MKGDTIAWIDPQWIDVDTGDLPFSSEMAELATGCMPRTDLCGSIFPCWEDTSPIMIPRDKWEALSAELDRDLSALVAKIKNQKSEGTCASNATTQALEIVLNLALSLNLWIEFSPISIYRWIAPGPGTGSTISDNLVQLRDTGALPVDSPRNRAILTEAGIPLKLLQAVGYSQSFPDDWKSVASLFRMVEWFDIRSFDGFASCLLAGLPVVYGRAGHAICGARLVRKDGKWYVKYANSWGDWGDNGFGYDSESYISSAISSYGAFAVRATTLPDPLVKLWLSNWQVASASQFITPFSTVA